MDWPVAAVLLGVIIPAGLSIWKAVPRRANGKERSIASDQSRIAADIASIRESDIQKMAKLTYIEKIINEDKQATKENSNLLAKHSERLIRIETKLEESVKFSKNRRAAGD